MEKTPSSELCDECSITPRPAVIIGVPSASGVDSTRPTTMDRLEVSSEVTSRLIVHPLSPHGAIELTILSETQTIIAKGFTTQPGLLTTQGQRRLYLSGGV